MKKIVVIIALVFGFIANSQNWQGTYQTKFGVLKLVEENGIIYGDYANNGTILAYEVIDKYKTTLNGIYFNGNERGKFQLIRNRYGSSVEYKFIGYYGAADNSTSIADIKVNSQNWIFTIEPKWEWTGTKQPSNQPNDLQTAVWNGKWNTTFGEINLEQIGTKIKGKYSNLGDIDADFDKGTKKLKGTFTNKGKKGYFEFSFEGNTFSGKWGWTSALTGGNWDGTKALKTNKEVANNAATTNSLSTSDQANNSKDEDNNVKSVKQGLRNSTKVTSNKTLKITLLKIIRGNNFTTRLEELYGFVGIEVFRVTNSGSQLVQSFGNKDKYFFNTTEDNAFPGNIFGKYSFSNQPNYVREFTINEADWNNPNVQFEIRLWHHIKGKIYGPNRDYGKYSETYNINTIGVDRNKKIWVGKDYNNGENTDSILDLDFLNSRALFKIEIQ